MNGEIEKTLQQQQEKLRDFVFGLLKARFKNMYVTFYCPQCFANQNISVENLLNENVYVITCHVCGKTHVIHD